MKEVKKISMVFVMYLLGSGFTWGDASDQEKTATKSGSEQQVNIKKMVDQIKERMQGQIQDAKKCASIADKACGDLGMQDCIRKKANAFPSFCRQQMAAVGLSYQQDAAAGLRPCLDLAMKSCPLPDDLQAKNLMFSAHQECMKKAMEKNQKCRALIDEKVKALSGSDQSSESEEAYRTFIK